MIATITQWILETLRYYGGWSVFLGVLIEQVIVPIPSPAIIMGAGAVLIPPAETWFSALFLSTWKIVLPGTVASTLGAWLGYWAGAWGGRVFVDRFQRFLGFSWADVQVMGQKMTGGGLAASTFFMRALPIVPLSLVSIVGGVLKVPKQKFLFWSFMGTIPRCYVLAMLGWSLGSNFLMWAKGVNRFESVMSLAIVAAIIGGILYIRRRVRKDLEGPKA